MGEKDKCFSCGVEMAPVFPRHVAPHVVDDPSFAQYNNALPILFDGGYGMFQDDVDNGSRYEVVICHECAHELCRLVPWVDKLLRPHGSHSHAAACHDACPDHWDGTTAARERTSDAHREL
jgi:hypothetical protein